MTTISASSIKRRKRVAADIPPATPPIITIFLFSSFNLTRPLGHPATNVNHVIVFLAKILPHFAAHAGLANHIDFVSGFVVGGNFVKWDINRLWNMPARYSLGVRTSNNVISLDKRDCNSFVEILGVFKQLK